LLIVFSSHLILQQLAAGLIWRGTSPDHVNELQLAVRGASTDHFNETSASLVILWRTFSAISKHKLLRIVLFMSLILSLPLTIENQ
jgi:hypothetical protein